MAKIIARRDPVSQIRLLASTASSLRQAAQMDGCLEALAVPDGRGVFFAISRWRDESALQAYVKAGAHGKAAKLAKQVARCHVSGHVEWEGEIPSWDSLDGIMVHGRIIDMPKVGKLTDEQKRAGPRRPFRGVLRAKIPAATAT